MRARPHCLKRNIVRSNDPRVIPKCEWTPLMFRGHRGGRQYISLRLSPQSIDLLFYTLTVFQNIPTIVVCCCCLKTETETCQGAQDVCVEAWRSSRRVIKRSMRSTTETIKKIFTPHHERGEWVNRRTGPGDTGEV
jgi:hypothetical protein